MSHDRAFVRRLATRIAEIDRGQLHVHSGSYDDFIRNRDARLAVEETQAAVSDARLSEEEKWVRQSISARRTRNEGGARTAKNARRATTATTAPGQRATPRARSRTLWRVSNRSRRSAFRLQRGRTAGPPASLLVGRGDKIGVVGPNGSGKTTLLHMLLGQLQPQRGSVRHGTRLQIAHFDQLRAQLNLDEIVAENIAPGQEYLDINGQRRHVYGYLQDFLFTPARANARRRTLRRRAQPTPLGAPLRQAGQSLGLGRADQRPRCRNAVSSGRTAGSLRRHAADCQPRSPFLDNAVTSLLVFEGDGQIGEYAGGYSDWLRRAPVRAGTAHSREEKGAQRASQQTARAQIELQRTARADALPDQIEALEGEQSALHEQMVDPAFYRQNGEDVTAAQTRLEQIDNDLSRLTSVGRTRRDCRNTVEISSGDALSP